MKFKILVSLCLFNTVFASDQHNAGSHKRESRKLFGGYRITPRFCKPSRQPTEPTGGPNICMFNHECLQRNGEVVGACMDGFLFGACCQLPSGESTGDFLESELISVGMVENKLSTIPATSTVTRRPPTTPAIDITSNGVSQLTAALLNPGLLPTAQDNTVIQVSDDQPYFSTTGVTHPEAPDTILLNQQDNEIDPGYFMPTNQPVMEDRKTTVRHEDTTLPYSNSPVVHISISNAALEYTTSPGFHRPMFRPKPSKPSDADKYVLVPTIMHEISKPNKTQEYDSIVNILHMLNNTSTKKPQENTYLSTNKPPSTSYVFSSTSTMRPGSLSDRITSLKPPSTSYVFSTTIPPRRTELPTTTKKKPSPTKKPKPTKSTTKRPNPTIIITKKPSTSFAYHSSPTKTTVANSAAAFITSQRPPSTSYVFSNVPTRRPPSTVNTHIAGPGFSVTSNPSTPSGEFSNFPSPAPTLIVLGPVTDNEIIPERPPATNYEQYPVTIHRPTAIPQRKPINQVTINNHVTQNIYSTSEGPSPTVLITPKPSIPTSLKPQDYSDTVEVGTPSPSPDDFINFPPVRNPNLNMSSLIINEDDITTPAFVEDEKFEANVESFVNKIIQGLQEPFNGLRDVVYNRNKTTVLLSSSTGNTTKKPVKKQGTTTKKPVKGSTPKPVTSNVRPATSTRPTIRPVTTRKPTTRRPTTTVPTRRQTTTTKRTRTTRKPVTTTQSLIDHQTEDTAIDNEDYRTQCGARPLMKTARIVGGKGAAFGEFPWQVLVRESTWLGLFTKNKCGGVLISHKYVMTAAHCQPGFLASLVVVFGEFDISGDLETKRSISRNVKRVIVHRQYDAATFANDLALLELEQPVQFDAHIIPICLPRDGVDFTGRMATVTGWGRLKYGGGVPSVLQEVQVPIMENPVCQEMFRTAGHSKVILDSFLCAGYANGQKDSCEGDSGGPLVLQRPDGRYQLAGTVSHGIKCAAPYLPGVYMRTQFFKPWITSITGVTSP